jgi:hypothetical protein
MFTLEQVVPWGRSLDEYRRMFDLSADDLRLRILGCADGPASFNAEATAAGFSVTSCDPLYRFSAADIARRITHTTEAIIEQTKRNQEEFVWTVIRSTDELRELRVAAMERFLADFETGKSDGRYVDAELPTLPFDTALTRHTGRSPYTTVSRVTAQTKKRGGGFTGAVRQASKAASSLTRP